LGQPTKRNWRTHSPRSAGRVRHVKLERQRRFLFLLRLQTGKLLRLVRAAIAENPENQSIAGLRGGDLALLTLALSAIMMMERT
jgi:hypothetical protein